ncbi:MAG: hypothetical protein CL608_14015 [Anaerolineaceae bacterium]|nr:hypothetical protein [Anaerolineaceae bacterium]
MQSVLITIIVFGVVIVLFAITSYAIAKLITPTIKKQYLNLNEAQEFPYLKQHTLFSDAERAFFNVLNQAVGKDVQIFGKVRVADVIVPKKGMSKSEWHRAFNKISAKHFDFVLCNNQDLSVICVVELNDATHQKQARQKRDMFLVAACRSASVPLIQIPVKSSYNIDELRKLLLP